MTDFSIKWLKGCSIALIVFGLLYAVIDLPVIGIPARLFAEAAFMQPLQGAFPTEDKMLVGTSGILGAVTFFLGSILYFAVEGMAKTNPETLRRAIMITLPIWYILDQWASFRGGAYGNMVSNTLILVAFVLPFMLGKRKQALA
jgi:hypothetical protein